MPPVMSWLAYLFVNSKKIGAALGVVVSPDSWPSIFDLANDLDAAAILKTLAKKPWDELSWQALRDRAEELGADEAALKSIRAFGIEAGGYFREPGWFGKLPGRRKRLRIIKQIREILKRRFGDYESQELPF